MPTLADILVPAPSPLYKEGALGMAQHPDMARIGPQAWAELHAWAERLRAQVGDSCGCGEFAVMGARAFHDLVSAKLGKPVMYPEVMEHMAWEYATAAGIVAERQGGVSAKARRRLLPVAAYSDFQPGRDVVVRENGRTFIRDSKEEYADTEVESDRMPADFVERFRVLTPEHRIAMERAIRVTPVLSEEGRTERLKALTDAGLIRPLFEVLPPLQPALFQGRQASFSQAFMERVMAVPREQLGFGFDFPLPPGARAAPSVFTVVPDRPRPSEPYITVVPDKAPPVVPKPFPFQAEGIAWLKQREAALLADDMGLGKTNQAIYWAADRQPVLVIVPSAVTYNWADEIQKWRPGDTTTVLDKDVDVPNRLTQWTVMSYGAVPRYLNDLRRAGFKSLIMDEAHYVKNMQAKRTQAVLDLVAPLKSILGEKPITSRLAVTGTPVTNRPPELFSLLVFLGKKDRRDEPAFLARYTLRQSAGGHEFFVGYQNLDELHAFIKPFTLRRLKRDVLTQLPPKRYRPVYVGITNPGEYHEAEVNFLSWLREHVGDQAADRISFSERAQILVQMNYLRQIAARGKVKPVADFLKPCYDQGGHKTLVFSNFLEVLEDLHDAKGGIIYTGATPKQERNDLVKRYQGDPRECFFFGSFGAAGTGITLTSADRVVMVDLPWTPALKAQSEDRAHRIGQKNPVEIVPFLARGTIDERMVQLISDKEKIIAQVIDGFEADRAALESVTTQLMGEFMGMAKARQDPAPPPLYISDEEAEELQGWSQDGKAS